ncbi:MAG: class I SAM-dependent methyltransferase [Pirellulaceae bacterium]
MSFYARYCFAPLMDWSLSRPAVNALRASVVAPTAGRVLEIGFGTGLNLAFYRPEVTSLTLLDPETLLPARVKQRMDQSAARQVVAISATAETLPFRDEAFDHVVSTFTLCTIPDVAAALAEVRRVLRPRGSLRFLEHGRSDSRSLARWQDRLNPLQQFWACGCNLNRPIEKLIRGAGFSIEQLDRSPLPGVPSVLLDLSRGIAVR